MECKNILEIKFLFLGYALFAWIANVISSTGLVMTFWCVRLALKLWGLDLFIELRIALNVGDQLKASKKSLLNFKKLLQLCFFSSNAYLVNKLTL